MIKYMVFYYQKSLLVKMPRNLTFSLMLNNFSHSHFSIDPIRTGGRSWQSARPKASASTQW